jgi:lipoprotein NlpD
MLNRRTPGQKHETTPATARLAKLVYRGAICSLTALALTACETPTRRTAAPVVEHTGSSPVLGSSDGGMGNSAAATPATGGLYVVKPGDSLRRIATANGLDWRDLQQWNNLPDANQLRPGQELRLHPAGGSAPAAMSPAAPPPGTVQTAPIGGGSSTQTRPLDAAPGTGVAEGVPASPPAVLAKPPAPATPVVRGDGPDERVDWAWPASGKLIEGFNEARNKGLDIAGNPGDPVLAAADGKVVYSGSGLRGYGNLIIIKHNNTYLSAYAHNRALLIKEGQEVKRGQRIAELGQTDAATPRVHFEIRRQGKPVDPAGFLPAR